jgi:hypothetical protein
MRLSKSLGSLRTSCVSAPPFLIQHPYPFHFPSCLWTLPAAPLPHAFYCYLTFIYGKDSNSYNVCFMTFNICLQG